MSKVGGLGVFEEMVSGCSAEYLKFGVCADVF